MVWIFRFISIHNKGSAPIVGTPGQNKKTSQRATNTPRGPKCPFTSPRTDKMTTNKYILSFFSITGKGFVCYTIGRQCSRSAPKGMIFMSTGKKISPKTGKISWFATFYYTDWTGTRRQKKKEGFATQREAKEFERAFLERAAGNPDMTFQALTDLYLQDYKEHYRPTSYENKSYNLQNYVLPFFKDIPINAIAPGTVRKWQTVQTSTNAFAPSTLHLMHSILSAVLNFAVKYYGLPNNPARLAGTMGKEKSRPLDFWTLDEFKQFQEAVKGNAIYYTMYTLLFYTGIRKGELLALALSDFDFAAGTLTISKTYKRLYGHDLIQPPKTDKGNRTIAIPPFLLDIIKDYAARIYGLKPQQRLFEATCVQSLKYNLDKYSALAKVKRIRVHDLRHSHASLLIEQGFSPLVIKERLGHEDIQTTLNTYSHLYPSKQEEIAGRLQDLATGSGTKKIRRFTIRKIRKVK